MITRTDLNNLNSKEIEILYSEDPVLLESLVIRYYADALLEYCQKQPTYNMETDPYGLFKETLKKYFEKMKKGQFSDSILIDLKYIASELVKN